MIKECTINNKKVDCFLFDSEFIPKRLITVIFWFLYILGWFSVCRKVCSHLVLLGLPVYWWPWLNQSGLSQSLGSFSDGQ